MRIIEHPNEMQRWSEEARLARQRIAFVPTMGYLHEGHLSLMREGRKRGDLLVVSIFVNPTQFGPNEDLARYPRDFNRDRELMEPIPVDVVFVPSPSDIYPPGFQSWVEVTEVTRGLCGAHRPGHFRGVATVVAKLFNIVKPHLAIFGEKDYQQLLTIQQMVRDLNFDVTIVPAPTVRESDGLAMSSRNSYLTPSERQSALAISRALRAAQAAFEKGATQVSELREAAQAVLAGESGLRVEYLEIVRADDPGPVTTLDEPILVAIAAHCGTTRLIDNLRLARRKAD